MPGRPTLSWELLPKPVYCLFTLARSDDGATDAALRQMPALLALPAVQRHLAQEPASPRLALIRLCQELEQHGGGLLSAEDLNAVRAVLRLAGELRIHRGADKLQVERLTRAHGQRAEVAARLLKESPRMWREGRTDPVTGVPTCVETEFLERFVQALVQLEPRASTTAPSGWTAVTPLPLLEPTATGLLGGLQGTWSGVTLSEFHIKATGPHARAGRHHCFMVVDHAPTCVRLSWHFPSGFALATALQPALVGGQLRLNVMYESTSAFPGDEPGLSHRGAAVLDLLESPNGASIQGPYWTDRTTSGRLEFLGPPNPLVAVSYEQALAAVGRRQ